MVQLPARYSNIKTELSAYVRTDEVKDILDKAEAMKIYAYQSRDGDLAEHTADIRERAVRRLGELMKEAPKAKNKPGPGRGKKGEKAGFSENPAFSDQGIDKNLAHRARRAAKLSDEEFEAHVGEAKELAKAAAEGKQAVVRAAKNKLYEEKARRRKEREQ
jgi:hypothetical protein